MTSFYSRRLVCAILVLCLALSVTSVALAVYDVTPPTIEILGFDKTQVEIGETIKLSVRITDDSGIRDGLGYSIKNAVSQAEIDTGNADLVYNASTGLYEACIWIPSTASAGDWYLQQISVWDVFRNYASYYEYSNHSPHPYVFSVAAGTRTFVDGNIGIGDDERISGLTARKKYSIRASTDRFSYGYLVNSDGTVGDSLTYRTKYSEVPYLHGTEIVGLINGLHYIVDYFTGPEYGIYYYIGGGTNHQDNPTEYTADMDDIILKNATRGYYSFAGWYTDTNYTEEITKIEHGSEGNIYLCAKWIDDAGEIVPPGSTPVPSDDVNIPDLPTGSDFTVYELSPFDNLYDFLTTQMEEGERQLGAYDIDVSGEIPSDGIIISFNVGTRYTGKNLQVLHYHNGDVEKYNGIVDEQGVLSIRVRDFSPFMIVLPAPDPDPVLGTQTSINNTNAGHADIGTTYRGSFSEGHFIIEADCGKQTGVALDGKPLQRDVDYTASCMNGTTIIFTDKMLNGLKDGSHTLVVYFKDGSASTMFTTPINRVESVAAVPATGNTTILPIVILYLAAFVLLLRKKACA